MTTKNPLSLQRLFDPEDFMPATNEEKESLVVMRESVGFWRDGARRLRKNKVAMTCLVVIIIIMIFAFIVPSFYPYTYSEQIQGANNMKPFEFSAGEQARIDAGEHLFPHIFGTDKMGRDYAIRVMMGSRISLLVGMVAAVIILIIGSIYGSIAAFAGGWVDLVMMRIVDIIYTIPDILLIVLLSFAFKAPLKALAQVKGFHWLGVMGENLVSIFVVFALLYWVGMARMVRSQILQLKESEYVTAAKALGASSGRIIRKHLLTNCIGTLIVITTLQIPSSIFTESFLSFLGLGVSAPMASLGSLCSDALGTITIFPYRLLFPGFVLTIIVLTLNLVGDGLRDALDPRLKK